MFALVCVRGPAVFLQARGMYNVLLRWRRAAAPQPASWRASCTAQPSFPPPACPMRHAGSPGRVLTGAPSLSRTSTGATYSSSYTPGSPRGGGTPHAGTSAPQVWAHCFLFVPSPFPTGEARNHFPRGQPAWVALWATVGACLQPQRRQRGWLGRLGRLPPQPQQAARLPLCGMLCNRRFAGPLVVCTCTPANFCAPATTCPPPRGPCRPSSLATMR